MIELPSWALDQLPTPCLVVDAGAASRNIQRCAAFFSGQRAALRPHFKAHKCTSLMRQQLDAGNCAGVACQTSWEALVLARWQAALRLPNVHGLVAGRALLYPPGDDVAAAVDAAVSLLPYRSRAPQAGSDRRLAAG